MLLQVVVDVAGLESQYVSGEAGNVEPSLEAAQVAVFFGGNAVVVDAISAHLFVFENSRRKCPESTAAQEALYGKALFLTPEVKANEKVKAQAARKLACKRSAPFHGFLLGRQTVIEDPVGTGGKGGGDTGGGTGTGDTGGGGTTTNGFSCTATVAEVAGAVLESNAWIGCGGIDQISSVTTVGVPGFPASACHAVPAADPLNPCVLTPDGGTSQIFLPGNFEVSIFIRHPDGATGQTVTYTVNGFQKGQTFTGTFPVPPQATP